MKFKNSNHNAQRAILNYSSLDQPRNNYNFLKIIKLLRSRLVTFMHKQLSFVMNPRLA